MGTALIKSKNTVIAPRQLQKESKTTPFIAEEFRYPSVPQSKADQVYTYEKCVWAYASVYVIATSAASVPLKIYDVKDENKPEEIMDADFKKVLKNPNPFLSEFDLKEATYTYLELTGDCYWELVRDGSTNKITEIYPLRPDRMKIQGDPKKLVGKYIYHINGKDIPFEPHEILHFKYMNPLNDMYGFSPIGPAVPTITIDLYALSYNRNFFKSGARIGGVLETDRHLSNDAIERLETSWAQEYGGYAAAWRTAVLQEGLKYKEISPTHKEMDFMGLRKQAREEVFAVMGVYPILFGLMEYANYATAYQQKRLFYQNTITPKLKKVSSQITKLIQLEKKNIEARFDIESIEALKEEAEVQAKIDVNYVDSGIKTINEVRSEHRLPPVSWGNTWWPRKGTRTPVGPSTHVERSPGTGDQPVRIFNQSKRRTK